MGNFVIDTDTDGAEFDLVETRIDQPEGIEPALWQNLLDLGLTPSEAKVYLALISHGSLTAVDACKISGVPRAKIYEVFNNLSSNGLCFEVSGKKKRYSAVNPVEGLQQKLETARRDLEQKERLASSTGEQLLAIFKTLENASSLISSTVYYLSNADLTAKVYLRILGEAQEEILFLSKAPYNVSIKNSQNHVQTALARGVRIKSIGESAECQNKDALTSLRENQAKGADLRVLSTLPCKLIMVDQKYALLTLYETEKEDFDASKASTTSLFSGILVEHIAIVNLLKVAFDSLWQQAVPLETYLARNLTVSAF
ncbi:MAG: TrmB family transcriptional regulator [Chloroflexi bacterium]|nr:TrmB family transcriptional regulator [Chloroflexota bacterium]OJV92737.1 MAG: hypothetical protein BGO39_29640 [Chloroflexi bacterium 54-19]